MHSNHCARPSPGMNAGIWWLIDSKCTFRDVCWSWYECANRIWIMLTEWKHARWMILQLTWHNIIRPLGTKMDHINHAPNPAPIVPLTNLLGSVNIQTEPGILFLVSAPESVCLCSFRSVWCKMMSLDQWSERLWWINVYLSLLTAWEVMMSIFFFRLNKSCTQASCCKKVSK